MPSQSKGFPSSSDDKAFACKGAEPFWYPGLEDPQEKEMVGYSPLGHKESDMTEWPRFHTQSKSVTETIM